MKRDRKGCPRSSGEKHVSMRYRKETGEDEENQAEGGQSGHEQGMARD